MKSLNNGFIAEKFSTRELKEMQTEITRVLKEREEETETLMRQLQEKLDRFIDAIEGAGFFVGVPDCPTRRVMVMKLEDD